MFEYPSLAFRNKKYIANYDKKRKSFDVIIVTGDAYVDHPSFPTAVICRLLQYLGLSVAIIAQPDWNNDENFKVWENQIYFSQLIQVQWIVWFQTILLRVCQEAKTVFLLMVKQV